MKVDSDLKVDSRSALPRPLAGVFNASDNLGMLHRLEIRPKDRLCLDNLGWNSDDVNVHPVLLKARSLQKLMDVSVFERTWFPAA